MIGAMPAPVLGGSARLGPVVVLCALAALTASPSRSQLQVLEPEESAAHGVLERFLSLHGEGCAVGFLPGGLDRADHLLRRVELVTHYFGKWADAPVPLAVYALGRSDWREVGLPGVYGLPLRSGPNAVFAPAEGDAGTVELWRRLLAVERVPSPFGQPLRGSAEEAGALALADVLLQVETARGFVQRAGLLGARSWVGEVAAHAVALVIFQLHEPERLDEIGRLYGRLAAGLGGDGANPAGSFSPMLQQGGPHEVERWLWFQGVYHEAARRILARDGRKSVKRLQAMSRKSAALLPASAVLERYPGVGEVLDRRLPDWRESRSR